MVHGKETGLAAITQKKWLFVSVLILLLAAVLCLPFADTYVMWADEYSVQLEGVRIALEGSRPLIGPQTTFQGISHHSSLTSFMMAIPYYLAPDPAIARIFVGLYAIIAIAIWMRTLRRYFGKETAIFTGILIAVQPVAIYWARFPWNPNIGLLFMPLWFLTGLLAYHEDKRWMAIVHWLVVSANVLSEAVLLYIIPISLCASLWRLIVRKEQRGHIAATTLIGIVLMLLTFVPWFIGLHRIRDQIKHYDQPIELTDVLTTFNVTDLARVPDFFVQVVGGGQFPDALLRWSDDPYGIWSSLPLNAAGWIQSLIAVIGIALLLRQWLRDPVANVPQGIISIMTFVPFGIILFARKHQPITDHFFVPVMYAGIAAAGYVLALLWARWKTPVILLVAAIICAQIPLTAGYLWWQHEHRYEYPNGNLRTINEHYAQFTQFGDSVIYLREREIEDKLPKEEQYKIGELYNSWDLLSTRHAVTTLLNPHTSLIVPRGERVALVTLPYTEFLPRWFGDLEQVGDMPDGSKRYVVVSLGPLEVQDTALEPNRFRDTALILGATHDEGLCSGEGGAVFLIWEPLTAMPPTEINASLRLIDPDDNQIYSTDFPTLERRLWRGDGQVLTRVEIPPLESQVTNLHLVMYTIPEIIGLEVVDENGTAMDFFVDIPLACP